MKKAHYILLLFFSFINLAKSQDCIELLIKDYKTTGITQEFKTFIANDPDGLLIYQKLSGSSFVARTDAEVLSFFKKLSTNNLDGFGTTLLKQLTDLELKLFAKNFGNLGKVDFQKLANNSELLSVWKKYKSLNFSKVDDLLEYSKVWKQEIPNITFDDFFIKTKDQFNIAIKETGDPKFATELFEAWKKGVGNEKELQQIYRKYKLDPNIVYPPCEGVWGITVRKALAKEYFDRFQKYESLSGSYVGVVAEGESFTIASRALKENYQEIVENGADYYYFKFKFKEGYTGDLEIGEAIPWFDKIGGAQQGKIPNKLNEITDQIEIAEKWKLENGTWVKIDNALQGAGNWATAIGKNIDELVEAPLGYQIFTKNGSKYIRRIDATDINTPRLMVDETGSIVKYVKPQRLANSTKLRSNLEKVLGKAPDNHQVHHLVPSNVVEKSALHKEAINRGLYDVDRAGNGKFLAETDEDFVALSEAFPTHFGSHPNYDIQITKQIDDVLRANNLTPSSNLSNLTNQQLTNIIEDLSLNILENWKPSKLN
jgi:hypothetical protein